ncbi:MAG: glutathione-disulfide reductase [Pseudomonadota bacterium]
MSHFDLFAIGGGSGGVACARRAASYGAKVGIAEHSRVGGTCVIRGCVPKKLMHYAAHFADFFKAAEGYGWDLPERHFAFEKLLKARNKEIQRLNDIYIGMLDRAGVTLFPDRAVVAGRSSAGFEIRIGDETHTSNRVLIAVGGRPSFPKVEGLEHAITSDHVLEDLYGQPREVAVVGAGYIGIELASIFNGLGCATRVIYRADQPLRGFDDDIRSELVEQFAKHGLELMAKTEVSRLKKSNGRTQLETTAGELEADLVIYATGRKPVPNTRGIGLEDLGVAMEDDGAIKVDRAYRSSVEGILAVGDASDHAGSGLDGGQFDLTPVAIAEGRVIAESLFNANPHEICYETIPTAIFGIPQAASVGLAESTARERGFDVEIFRTGFRPMLYTLPDMAMRTMMKLVVDKATDKVLGCHLVGDDAAEMIQGVAIAMTAGATKSAFDATVGLHPTAAEELVTMYQPAAA